MKLSEQGKSKTASEVEIENKTLKASVVDRDRTMSFKNEKIAELNLEIGNLRKQIASMSKHPLTEDEEKAKVALSDYEATVELMVSRMRRPLDELSLFDVVRIEMVELNNVSGERDRYKGAFDRLQDEAKRTRVIAEGRS